MRVSKPMCWLIYMKWRYYVTNEEAAALPGHGAQKENEGSAAHSVDREARGRGGGFERQAKAVMNLTGMMEEKE